MRTSFRALSAALLLAGTQALAAEPPEPRGATYDPEVALLLLTIQKQSVELLRDELVRQAEWLSLGGMQVLLAEKIDVFARAVNAGLSADSDILEDYRQQILRVDPTSIGEADKLVAEIRRYHGLVPGTPMVRLAKPPPGPVIELSEEKGIGADVLAAVDGTPALNEPVAYAERRFGTTGPFLRRRKWNLDFYLGSFGDLTLHYKGLGYRRVYRLRAPYVSYGKEAYVLAPEPGLRPRLVYAGFDGRDLFVHTRAQWAIITERAMEEGPEVRTLSCSSCAYVLPPVRAMKSLLATVPYSANNVIVGYEHLFEPGWKESSLGVYENDYWRLSYFRTGATITATVLARRTNFGEILASSLTPIVRRGARRVYFAGPAAQVAPAIDGEEVLYPTQFLAFDGHASFDGREFNNALGNHKRASAVFGNLPSPLFATREWMNDARGRGILAFEGEMARLAQESQAWADLPGRKVECGIGAIIGELSSLHPEEDRSIHTVSLESSTGKESAKRRYRDAVLAKIKAAGAESAK